MAPPHLAQWIRPVSSVGPLMTAAGVTLGWRALSSACTASKVSRSMIGGTGTITISLTGFSSLDLDALVELVLAHIGAAGQDAVDLADAPAPAVAGEDAAAVEIADDVLDAQLAGGAVAVERKPIDQPHRLGVERVDLQLLLDLGAALLGGDDAIADGRQRTVPEALPGIFLQGPQTCLAFSLDWYSSNSAMIWRIMTCMGSSPISWVMETSLTPFFASFLT